MVCLCLCVYGWSLEFDRTITQFHHTTWTSKEGAPAVILSIAQTTDGYLWLGSLSGLFRFDGVRFEQYQPRFGEKLPSNQIASLLALPDGSLWIGFMRGGATLLVKDRATNYGEHEGLPPGRLAKFAQDQSGTMWAAIWGGGLARLDNGHWKVVGADWNFPAKAAQTVFVDRSGTVWVATNNTILFLSRGARTFQPTGEDISVVTQIAEAPDGKLWLAETARNVRPMRFPDRHASVPEVRAGSQAILFDDTGALWATSVGDGIVWVDHPGEVGAKLIRQDSQAVVMFTHKDGLTDDVVLSIFQDREKNIWVGTPKGMERFRKSNLVPTVFPPGYQRFAIAAGDNGAVWVGSQSRPLALLKDNKLEQRVLPIGYVGCTYRDPDGEIWLGGVGDVYRIRAGKISHLRLPLPHQDLSAVVNALTKDQLGRLWVSMAGQGVWTLEDSRWERYENAALPRQTVTAAYTDAHGRVWFGYGSNMVAVLDHERVQVFGSEDGIATGGVKVISGRNEQVWIGGESGVGVFQQNRFQVLDSAGPKPFSGISGIVETADGSIWLSESRGVIQIPPVEVQSALRDRTYKPSYQVFDYADGLRGAIQQVATPTAIEGTDGRLWFATVGGLVSIDPAGLLRNTRSPSVLVRSVSADGEEYLPGPNMGLPIRTANIQVDYTALSLSVPERVLFRYKLDGVDKDWQDAGTRREAFFNNLGPGRYRFHVVASNNDGVWNEEGADVEFGIAPAWYQAYSFRFLCVAAGLFVLWCLYQLRVRRVAALYRGRMEARIAERERIARELHDTLLQSFQAVLMKFHAGVKMIRNRPDDAETMLERTLDQAEQAIVEGRDAVQGLRSSTIITNDLARAIQALGAKLATDQGDSNAPDFGVQVDGTSRDLAPIVRDDVYRIAGEAVRNAFKHANALRIEVEIQYDQRHLRLRIRDDGKGIDPKVLEAGARAGHYGLPGLQERARVVGGKLTVWSEPGSGTEIQLTIPASVVYASASGRRAKLLRKSAS
jgi:signal transduction histidine kinase/ligand-binding sensor domain-containing protein